MAIIRWESAARSDLRRYRHWLRREAGAAIADPWIAALLDWVDELENFPDRGTPRDDLGTGIRTRVFRRSLTIAYVVDSDRVSILHLFGRGRDVTAAEFGTP